MSTLVGAYKDFLTDFAFDFQSTDFVYIVGAVSVDQGWMLHVSVVPEQIGQLLDVFLPYAKESNIHFKLIKNDQLHHAINNGQYGPNRIGKVLTIYPEPSAAAGLADWLIKCTRDLRGPKVLTDYLLGGTVYTRYGAFRPIFLTDEFGARERLLKTMDGRLAMDKYYLPPLIPDWSRPPFRSFNSYEFVRKAPRLISGKYQIVSLLKSNIKGNAYSGYYLNGTGEPVNVFIKEGNAGTYTDGEGRDVVDRLEIQYELIQRLSDVVHTPHALDLVQEKEVSYLITGHITGVTLAHKLNEIKGSTPWFETSIGVKKKIIGYLLEAVRNVGLMHKKGYIHRDISGANFLIDEEDHLHLIDLELVYSEAEKYPNPPIGGGTRGFVSPQQGNHDLEPAYEDDIYSIGAVLSMAFIGVDPSLFLEQDGRTMLNKLDFFLHCDAFSNLIVQCLHPERSGRPDLDMIHQALIDYKDGLGGEITSIVSRTSVSETEIREVLDDFVRTLSTKGFQHDNLWFSQLANPYDWEIYPLFDRHTYAAIHRGVAGVVYLLERMYSLGFEIGTVKEQIDAATSFIQGNILDKLDQVGPGLHYGSHGIALVLGRLVRSGPIDIFRTDTEVIRKLLAKISEGKDVIHGAAGIGLANLQCSIWLPGKDFAEMAANQAKTLIREQQRDGSWVFDKEKGERIVGFGYGLAGITYFLLECLDRIGAPGCMEAIQKALAYLDGVAIKSNTCYQWHNSNISQSTGSGWCHGAPGIALTYLKAYEILKDQKYVQYAEMALRSQPKHLVFHNLSQCHGMSGLGEIYLEAFRITGNQEWLDRATWIADLLLHLKMSPEPGRVFWYVNNADTPTADLMIGSSGVAHFLLRYLYRDRVFYPLLPEPKDLQS